MLQSRAGGKKVTNKSDNPITNADEFRLNRTPDPHNPPKRIDSTKSPKSNSKSPRPYDSESSYSSKSSGSTNSKSSELSSSKSSETKSKATNNSRFSDSTRSKLPNLSKYRSSHSSSKSTDSDKPPKSRNSRSLESASPKPLGPSKSKQPEANKKVQIVDSKLQASESIMPSNAKPSDSQCIESLNSKSETQISQSIESCHSELSENSSSQYSDELNSKTSKSQCSLTPQSSTPPESQSSQTLQSQDTQLQSSQSQSFVSAEQQRSTTKEERSPKSPIRAIRPIQTSAQRTAELAALREKQRAYRVQKRPFREISQPPPPLRLEQSEVEFVSTTVPEVSLTATNNSPEPVLHPQSPPIDVPHPGSAPSESASRVWAVGVPSHTNNEATEEDMQVETFNNIPISQSILPLPHAPIQAALLPTPLNPAVFLPSLAQQSPFALPSYAQQPPCAQLMPPPLLSPQKNCHEHQMQVLQLEQQQQQRLLQKQVEHRQQNLKNKSSNPPLIALPHQSTHHLQQVLLQRPYPQFLIPPQQPQPLQQQPQQWLQQQQHPQQYPQQPQPQQQHPQPQQQQHPQPQQQHPQQQHSQQQHPQQQHPQNPQESQLQNPQQCQQQQQDPQPHYAQPQPYPQQYQQHYPQNPQNLQHLQQQIQPFLQSPQLPQQLPLQTQNYQLANADTSQFIPGRPVQYPYQPVIYQLRPYFR